MSKDKYLDDHQIESKGNLTISASGNLGIETDGSVGIGTDDPQKDLVVAGDDAVVRIGINIGDEGANFSSRIEMAENCSGNDGVMTHGGFIEWNGDYSTSGQFVFGARDDSTTDVDIFKINRAAAENSLCITATGVGIDTASPAHAFSIVSTATVGPMSISQYNDGVDGPNLFLRKARGTEDAPEAVQDETTGEGDDYLGSIDFTAYDGSDFNSWAYVKARVDGDVSTGNHYSRLILGTSNNGEADTKVTIKHDGKVGIGTTDPDTLLHVSSTDNASLADGTGALVVGTMGGNNLVFDKWAIQARDDGSSSVLYLQHDEPAGTSPSISMCNTGGYVGIGTVVPTNKLSIISEVDGRGNLDLTQYTGDATGPNVKVRKARGTEAEPVNINGNDWIGAIDFCGRVDGEFNINCAIRGYSDNTSGVEAPNQASGLQFFTTGTGNNLLTKMKIDSKGEVTIGDRFCVNYEGDDKVIIGVTDGDGGSYRADGAQGHLNVVKGAKDYPGIYLSGWTDDHPDICVIEGEKIQFAEWDGSQSINNVWIGADGYLKGYDGDSTAGTPGTAINYDYTFTGQHRNIIDEPDIVGNIDEYRGLIVSSSGEYDNTLGGVFEREPTMNEALPICRLSRVRNDKTVWGAISAEEDIDERGNRLQTVGKIVSQFRRKNDEEENRFYVNSLGEGAVWICNINGDLENGDYITTCEVPGYGMRQDDDLLHNYTVAKITQDCIFDLDSNTYVCKEFVHEGTTYRKAFVGCTYHCG